MPKPKLSPHFYRELLFWVGVIATISYRIIVILNQYSPVLVEIAWYIGTIGFVWYFAHRWRVENKRDKLVENLKLTEKIEKGDRLEDKDRDAAVYILSGLKTSKAKWNYIAIMFFSAIALVYAIYNNLSSWLN